VLELTAERIIRLLDLKPHPEGGHYRETFRDARVVDAATSQLGRAASTAIYFLLAEGEVSRWHRVDAAEIWHWYAGSPLLLGIKSANTDEEHITLGPALEFGERPQAVVPAGAWQQARSTGAYTLVGCTVAPGFTFDSFELAPHNAIS
jgi:uncharacterized protein